MDEFETINLDNKECKICKQETGEELISCILRQKLSTEEKSMSSTNASNEVDTSFAHRVCLERWDTVMKNTCFRQPKKTWKDRFKGFISTGSTDHSATQTWTPVVFSNNVEPSDANDNQPIFESTKREKISSGIAGHSVFSESKEFYRVENVGNRDSEHGQWRRNKVRICSIDSDEGEKPASELSGKQKVIRVTRAKLQECDVVQLKDLVEGLKLQINNVSSDLVTHLQERDSHLVQKHTMKVTVGQLVNLQSNIKTSSTQIVPKPTTSTRGCQNNYIIT